MEFFGPQPALMRMMGSNRPKRGERGEIDAGARGSGEVRSSGVYASDPSAAAPFDDGPCTSLEDACRRYRRAVWALVLQIGVDANAAEDVVGHVFVQLVEHVGAEGMPADLPRVLFGLAVKEARNHRRRSRRGRQRIDAEAVPESVAQPSSRLSPERLYARAAWAAVVRGAVDKLPRRGAAVLRSVDLGERTEEEAAAHLGWRDATVRSTRNRAKNYLRKLVLRLHKKESR